jgi:disulfide bond formation protein DsbB
MSMLPLSAPRPVLALLLVLSAGAVGTALLTQYVGGLAPCELCLYQRWPYYAAIVLTLLGLVSGGRGEAKILVAICALLFAGDAVLAFYHVGVEQHWFAGPTACTASGAGAGSIEALKAQLLNQQPIRCDEPQWQFHGVTLAGLNFLAAIVLCLLSLTALPRLSGGRRR